MHDDISLPDTMSCDKNVINNLFNNVKISFFKSNHVRGSMAYCHLCHMNLFHIKLRPSINGLVTDGNTNICCCGFILALFQSITANKLDSEQYPRL